MQANFPSQALPYPARLEGYLGRPSRWLWLVKWLLVLPHCVVLAFLWLAFVLLSVAAFFALLVGRSYPRGIFDFNVGVLRWTWRVAFYAFNANGTDRYPPFTLADVPEYPARLEVAYPSDQRHGLPLVGWWLAGIPQYLVAGVFAGSGGWFAWSASRAEGWTWALPWGGLIGLLVFFAVVVLLVRGEYPRSIFDFVLGLNRWVLRVGAYAALMTREYPPFRLDAGETDPGGLALAAPPPAAPTAPAVRVAPAQTWGAGRVLGVIVASLGIVVALCAVAAATTGIVLDRTQRDAAGYVMTGSETFSTRTYAFVSESYRTGGAGDLVTIRDLLGDVRVQAQSGAPVFVGIGPAADVDRYLGSVRREVGAAFGADRSSFDETGTAAPAGAPAAQDFWAARATGADTQVLTWAPQSGEWRVVLMNADASRGVEADLAVGAELPHLLSIGLGVLAGGALLLLLAVGGLYLAVRRR